MYQRYPLVHKDDQRVVKLIDPNIVSGPWIAGGAAIRWSQGLPVESHDIDVFCAKEAQTNALSIRLLKSEFYAEHDSDNATTYANVANGNKLRVQLIKKTFDTVQDLFDHFDFTVCSIATDGVELVKGPYFDRDNATKLLRLQNPRVRPEILKRLHKYVAYGYTPSEDLLDAIYDAENLKIDYDPMEIYDL